MLPAQLSFLSPNSSHELDQPLTWDIFHPLRWGLQEVINHEKMAFDNICDVFQTATLTAGKKDGRKEVKSNLDSRIK